MNEVYLIKERHGDCYYYNIDYQDFGYCHKSKCRYEPVWFLIRKQPLRHVAIIGKQKTYRCLTNMASQMIIDNDLKFNRVVEGCDITFITKPDFSKHVVLVQTEAGDCKARYEYDVEYDVDNKIYTFVVYDIYGGCRAMGRTWEHWVLIPKAPEGYKYNFKVYNVD